MAAIFLPLHGFMNFLVYIRPRYETYREKCHRTVLQAFSDVVRGSLIVNPPGSLPEEMGEDYNVAMTEAEVTYIMELKLEEEEEAEPKTSIESTHS
jgi:hypothetical protein